MKEDGIDGWSKKKDLRNIKIIIHILKTFNIIKESLYDNNFHYHFLVKKRTSLIDGTEHPLGLK